MSHHDWSLPTFQAALVIKIVHHNNSAYKPPQVRFKTNFSCQWWRACRWKESNERRMSQNKRRDGVEGYIITSTILRLLLSPHFFLFSYCFGTNRFTCHIGRSTQSTGRLLKVVYRGWPCLTLYTIDYSAIHQRSCKPLRGVCSIQAKFGKKVMGEKMRRSCRDKWAKKMELIKGGIRLFTGKCKVVILMGALLLLMHTRSEEAPHTGTNMDTKTQISSNKTTNITSKNDLGPFQATWKL